MSIARLMHHLLVSYAAASTGADAAEAGVRPD